MSSWPRYANYFCEYLACVQKDHVCEESTTRMEHWHSAGITAVNSQCSRWILAVPTHMASAGTFLPPQFCSCACHEISGSLENKQINKISIVFIHLKVANYNAFISLLLWIMVPNRLCFGENPLVMWSSSVASCPPLSSHKMQWATDGDSKDGKGVHW